MHNNDVTVIFGGTGFIGTHFACYLLKNELSRVVYLADIKGLLKDAITQEIKGFIESGMLITCDVDVRKPIVSKDLPTECSLVVNLAAVHREPGHEAYEYFETNLKGADEVCKWAEEIECERIIFTSSIAPYGPTELAKDEESLPTPVTAYGASKLVAEKTHIIWQKGDQSVRRLVIARPGVVFGPGEGGNVSRLIKAVLGRYFFYFGNRRVRKAGIYIKDLCHAMIWVLESEQNKKDGVSLFNMTMNPGPSVEEYVQAVLRTAKEKRHVPSVPYSLLYILSVAIDSVAKLFRIQQPISPVRVRKLVKSNNIVPRYLEKHGYVYLYDLDSAFVDWKKERPDEW